MYEATALFLLLFFLLLSSHPTAVLTHPSSELCSPTPHPSMPTVLTHLANEIATLLATLRAEDRNPSPMLQ